MTGTNKVLAVVILILIGIVGYTYITMRKEISTIISKSGSVEREVEKWRDEAGRSHARTETVSLLYDELLHSNNETIEELRKDVKSLKNFVSQIKIDVSTRDSLIIATRDTTYVIGTDTIRSKSFSYEDKWLTVNGELMRDSVKLNYTMRDNFKVTHEWMREGLFKPKELKLTVMSENPKSSLDNVQEIRVRPNPKVWYETRGFQLSVAAVFGYYLGNRK